MARPQSSEIRRSGKNPALEPEAAAAAGGTRSSGGHEHDAVPEDNRPGHHPEVEQDRPDPDAFLARARRVGRDESGVRDDEEPAPAAWAADPEATAASPALIARSVADGARRLAAGSFRAAAHVLGRLGDAIEPG